MEHAPLHHFHCFCDIYPKFLGHRGRPLLLLLSIGVHVEFQLLDFVEQLVISLSLGVHTKGRGVVQSMCWADQQACSSAREENLTLATCAAANFSDS
jgi:hypothetical protein